MSITLICVPHAGGTPAVFRGWSDSLSPGIDVQPVAISRTGGETAPAMPETASALASKLGDIPRPYAFFGHSLGAIVAFETIRLLLQAGAPAPARLFTSGSAAPQVEAARNEDLHRLPDDQFIEEVGRLGGLPTEEMADPELRSVLLPGLRADYALAETYTYTPGPPLPCSISVFRGQSDPFVDPGQLPRWGDCTSGELSIRTVPGDHFFLQTAAVQLHQAIREDLDSEVALGHPSAEPGG